MSFCLFFSCSIFNCFLLFCALNDIDSERNDDRASSILKNLFLHIDSERNDSTFFLLLLLLFGEDILAGLSI